MKNNRLIACIALSTALYSSVAQAGFFGPDTVTLTPAELQEKLRDQPLVFSTSAAPLAFNSRNAAVGGFMLGLVSSIAFASVGNSAGRGVSAQQNMQNVQQFGSFGFDAGSKLGRKTVESMNEQAIKSAGRQAKEGPLPWLAPQLQAAFTQAYGAQWRQPVFRRGRAVTSANDAKMELAVVQSSWNVDFSAASSDYSLSYKIDMTLTDLASKAINRSVACEGAFDKTMPEEDWKKDDFKAVADASKAVAELCLDKFLVDLNIPRVALAAEGAPSEGVASENAAPTAEPNMQTVPEALAVPQPMTQGDKAQ